MRYCHAAHFYIEKDEEWIRESKVKKKVSEGLTYQKRKERKNISDYSNLLCIFIRNNK